MRALGIPPALCALALILALVQAVAVHIQAAAPLSLCEYTPPQSRLTDLRLSFHYRYFDDQFRDDQDIVNSGSLKLDLVDLSDAPDQGFSIDAGLKLDLNQGAFSYKADGSGNFKRYLGGGDAFGFGGLDLGSATSLQALSATAQAGFGYGRFRDVTPLALALRIQEFLQRHGQLREPLPDEALEELASLIGQRPTYAVSALVGEIQRVLEASGRLADRLGARSLLGIEEILQEAAATKFCGWDVQLGLGYELMAPPGQQRDVLGTFAFNYALAPAPRSQFITHTRWTSTLNVLEDFFLNAQAQYSYRINENVNAQTNYTFLRSASPQQPPFDLQTLNLALGFRLQPALNLVINLDFTLASGYQEWARGLSVNLSYELF